MTVGEVVGAVARTRKTGTSKRRIYVGEREIGFWKKDLLGLTDVIRKIMGPWVDVGRGIWEDWVGKLTETDLIVSSWFDKELGSRIEISTWIRICFSKINST